MLKYTCGLCNRKTWRGGGKTSLAEDRECKNCKMIICPGCYKEYTKNDCCPKYGGEVYIPLF